MDKKSRMCAFFVHMYMFCSIAGICFLVASNDFATLLLSIGASSVYIAIGVFLAAIVNQFWGICSFLWVVLFPLLLVVSYIFAIKKHYSLMLLSVTLDTLISVLFVVYTVTTQNWHGFQQAIIDLVVSIGVLFVFVNLIRKPAAD